MLKFLKSGFYKNFKWVILLTLFSIVIELSIHFFLFSLYKVTELRQQFPNLIYFLPFAGLLIGYVYLFYGKSVSKGNNLLIDVFYNAKIKIPFIITPLIYFGTIITHLFGGSAGREGAGLQIASGYVDYFIKVFKYSHEEKNILLKVAIGGGFSAVFGTPFTGIFFAFEFFNIGKPNFKGTLSIIYVAFLVNYISYFSGLKHVEYIITYFPKFEWNFIIYLFIAGILFGLCARFFSVLLNLSNLLFIKISTFLPLRLLLGGIIILFLAYFVKTDIYLGIGISTIQDAFFEPQGFEVFLLKIIFTIITLGSGFKGGEVTPFFFIGATLGSFLSIFLPLPLGILTALGFVSVFAGATNTPIACFILAIELFGFNIVPYAVITCTLAYYSSGYTSIFKKQKITNFKVFKKPDYLGKRISEL